MKRIALYILLAVSIMVRPVMAYDFHEIVSSDHSHVIEHGHYDQEGEHAGLEVDFQGNPHDSSGHSHKTHHQHCECYRPYQAAHLAVVIPSSTKILVWKDRFYSDYSSNPLLEPPSRT